MQYERRSQEHNYSDSKDADNFDLQKCRLLQRLFSKMKKFIKWLVSHIFVRTVDLLSKPDDIAYDETKPHPAVEICVKGTF